jgi:hypothetical protein
MYFPHAFTAEIVQHDVGSERYRYTVIFVPEEVKADLPLAEYPKLRISGEVDDHPIEAALTPVRGEHYILLSKKLLAAVGKGVGDEVELRFRIADQDAVEVPERLDAALARDAAMRALWQAATPGKQRALAYMVASAKRAATQDQRIEKVAAVLRGEIDINGNPLG